MKTIPILLLLVTLSFAAAFATPVTPGAPLSWANYHIDTPPGAVYALRQARELTATSSQPRYIQS